MKRFLLLFLLPLLSLAQSGTVTKVTNTTLTATAGTAVCVFTGSAPVSPAGIHVVCSISGVNYLTQDAVIDNTVGIVGSFNPPVGAITWLLSQAVAGGPVSYQIVSAPTGGTSSGNVTGNF